MDVDEEEATVAVVVAVEFVFELDVLGTAGTWADETVAVFGAIATWELDLCMGFEVLLISSTKIRKIVRY